MKKGLALFIFLIVGLLAQATSTFVVTTVADPPPTSPNFGAVGTLYWAIKQANANSDDSKIVFNILNAPVPCVIQLNSSLPDITSKIEIDGSTQPDLGYNGIEPKIHIMGTATIDNGIVLTNTSSGSEIQNITISEFKSKGIFLYHSNNNLIKNNVIYKIGQTTNIVTAGIVFTESSSNIIKGNVIGTNRSKSFSGIGIMGTGLYLNNNGFTGGSLNNTIGGTNNNEANIIANCNFEIPPYKNPHVVIQSYCINNLISGNIIYSIYNTGIKIYEVTDQYPISGNYFLPPPYVRNAIKINGITEIKGDFYDKSAADGTKVELYYSDNGSNLLRYLGTTVSTNSKWSLLGESTLNVGDRVLAIATYANNNTTEVSSSRTVVSCNPFDPTFTSSKSEVVQGLNVTFTLVNTTNITSYSFDFGDGSSPVTTSPPYTHPYTTPGTYTVTLTATASPSSECVKSYSTTITVLPKVCCEVSVPTPGIDASHKFGTLGGFTLNKSSGTVLYKSNNCPAEIPFTCIGEIPNVPARTDVVSASVSTFSEDWAYDLTNYNSTNTTITNLANKFESGEANKWRVKKTLVYRSPIDKNSEKKNFERGTFDIAMFDWKNEANNDPQKWVLTSTVNKYTPNGQPLEDENILKIKSTALYGYNNTMPVLVAQNAAAGSTAFESFENTYQSNTKFENGLTMETATGQLDNARAHTGQSSIKLIAATSSNPDFLIADNLTVNQQVLTEGMVVRLWVWSNKDKAGLGQTFKTFIKVNQYKTAGLTTTKINSKYMTKVSSSGEWTLYESLFTPTDLATFSSTDKLSFQVEAGTWGQYYNTGDIYIDDVRVQPMQSEAVCYVYDKAHRLTAMFDDQHYALIYQYNNEGVLVRKLKETLEGVKTISDTQYNTKGESTW